MNVNFKKGEYTPRPDESVDITLGQMKQNTTSQAFHRLADLADTVCAARAALYGFGVEISMVRAWLDLHVQRLNREQLTPTQELHLLRALADLRHQHSAAALTAALRKVIERHDPQIASVPYLRAVLKNAASQRQPRPERPVDAAPPKTPQERWQRVLARLRNDLGEDNFRTWIEPIKFWAYNNKQLWLSVPDAVYAATLMDRYESHIRHVWRKSGGSELMGVHYVHYMAED